MVGRNGYGFFPFLAPTASCHIVEANLALLHRDLPDATGDRPSLVLRGGIREIFYVRCRDTEWPRSSLSGALPLCPSPFLQWRSPDAAWIRFGTRQLGGACRRSLLHGA